MALVVWRGESCRPTPQQIMQHFVVDFNRRYTDVEVHVVRGFHEVKQVLKQAWCDTTQVRVVAIIGSLQHTHTHTHTHTHNEHEHGDHATL